MLPLLVLIVILAVYLYIKWIYSHWKRTGLQQIEPNFLYGNVKNTILGRISIGDLYKNFYAEFKSMGLKHGGIYEFLTPAYVPIDTEIIKCILQKDFNHFMNHGEYVNEELDPLTGHLLALENERWKKLRGKLTPTFTSGKMKMMFPTMVTCTEGLIDILKDYAKIQDGVDIKDVLQRFTTDIIGSAAFGLDCNSLKDPNSEFMEFGRKIFRGSRIRSLKRMICNNLPKSFLSFIRFKRTDRSIEDFFMGVVRSTVDYRESNNIHRRDFMHLLLQLKNRGKVTEDESIFPNGDEKGDHFLTFNEVAAQCFVFFLAGFETSSTTMTFVLLELAKRQDLQDKLREEIKTVIQRHNNKITYEGIMEMSYLDKVVNETLRLHPPAPLTGRVCNAAYRIPNTDVIIQKGDKIRISILGIHRDPEYYPDPDTFDPERFNEENKAKRPNFSFLPFGEGPRICIGEFIISIKGKQEKRHLQNYFRRKNYIDSLEIDDLILYLVQRFLVNSINHFNETIYQ
ncbi:probable cytochrome P450 6a20 isoform X3 [Diorhabda carinulata]|nr:probable cytochrome P450 6a20 isoform X3 [Diorhabda carinulata]XP_057660421.1 probable cytochrome P450 6a20 isoform X3 [Diorhabda carinulata]